MIKKKQKKMYRKENLFCKIKPFVIFCRNFFNFHPLVKQKRNLDLCGRFSNDKGNRENTRKISHKVSPISWLDFTNKNRHGKVNSILMPPINFEFSTRSVNKNLTENS